MRRAQVTLVEPHPYHTIVTRLHAVAAGTLPPSGVTVPLERVAQGADLLPARATAVDTRSRRLWTEAGPLDYDLLVLSVGSVPAYHGIPGLDRFSLPLRTLEDALRVRRELAAPERLGRLVVGGAGLTGLELATEVASRPRRPREIVLVEALPEILPPFSPRLRRHVRAALARMGVELRTGARIEEVEPGRLRLAGDGDLEADLFVWTGGVGGAPLLRRLGEQGAALGRGGRLKVDASYAVPGAEGLYAVGDAADDGREPSAQLAVAQGERLGRLLSLRLAGRAEGAEAMEPPRLLGLFASLGPRDGFGRLRETELAGLPAHVVKWLAELRYLWRLGGRPTEVALAAMPPSREGQAPGEAERAAQGRS